MNRCTNTTTSDVEAAKHLASLNSGHIWTIRHRNAKTDLELEANAGANNITCKLTRENLNVHTFMSTALRNGLGHRTNLFRPLLGTP